MVKKIIPLDSYISAHDAAELLSEKLGRPVSSEYIRKLARRKKQPVRTQVRSNRLLYNREDLETVTIKKKSTPDESAL
jgi:predicted CopG family antitoxin